jgi:hypothetical protein
VSRKYKGTKDRFKPSDNRDSCTIEAKFAAQRGVCSAEHAFWAWLPFLTAQNLGERVENARHLWQNQGTRGIKIAISYQYQLFVVLGVQVWRISRAV